MFSYKDIYAEVAKEHGITPNEVKQIYLSFWKFIKQKIVHSSIPDGLTKEEFDNLRTAISIIRLGKFGVSWEKYSTKPSKLQIKKSIIKYYQDKQKLIQDDSDKESEADV